LALRVWKNRSAPSRTADAQSFHAGFATISQNTMTSAMKAGTPSVTHHPK